MLINAVNHAKKRFLHGRTLNSRLEADAKELCPIFLDQADTLNANLQQLVPKITPPVPTEEVIDDA